MRHILIDTDPGIDDALALIFALNSPEAVVEGVTTVVGNVTQEKALKNALKILEFLGVEGVPVAPGSTRPLLREPRVAEEIHGKTGLGGAVLPEPRLRPDERSAVELILDKVEEFGRDLTLVAIGPLTNIASALLVEPRLAEEVGRLVIMGGAFHVTPYGFGNVTPVAEFNIWHDPEAAKIVFDSGIPLTAVGLDVTTDPRNRLSPEALREIEGLGTRRARLVADLCRDLVHRFGGLNLHDPLAVAAAIDPRLVRTKPYVVDVETRGELTLGMTIADRRDPRRVWRRREPNVDVCVSVDGDRFMELFMERVVGV